MPPRRRTPIAQRTPRPQPPWDAAAVRALRVHLGATQGELAGEIGVRQQTVSEWETSAYQPRGASARMLSRIAEEAAFTYEPGSSHPAPPADTDGEDADAPR